MFYMGGMTLGYFSPHPAEAGAGEPAEAPSVTDRKAERKGLLDFLKPLSQARQPKSSRQPPAWPIHVFY